MDDTKEFTLNENMDDIDFESIIPDIQEHEQENTESSSSAETPSAPHKGHRKRMRDRFMNCGINSFAPHEIIEIILYNGISRKNTNELAHELIRRFDTVSGVLAASEEELLSVKGMTQLAVFQLKFINALLTYQSIDKSHRIYLGRNSKEIHAYFNNLYRPYQYEVTHATFLTKDDFLIDTICVGEGSEVSCSFSLNHIVQLAMNHNCNRVILSHNHPKGAAYPSTPDAFTTQQLKQTLSKLHVELVDHFIVGNNSVFSFNYSRTI